MHTEPRATGQSFGKERKKDFYMDPTFVNINHGSFGACPKTVMDAKWELQKQMEFNTQKWFWNTSEKLLTINRQLIADRINCPLDNLFMVLNSSDAFNILMKSIDWQKGDTVVLSNIAYTSIRKTIEYLKERYGINTLIVQFVAEDFLKEASILKRIQETINGYEGKLSVAVFDHIASKPAVIMPVGAISQFLKSKGIPFFVDGAHCIGQIPIDLGELNVDGYFSNIHKWGFAQKNCAFLYISDHYRNIVHPTITGNHRGEGLAREFFWTGTRDLTAYLTVKNGFQYLDSLGPEANTYILNLSHEAGLKMAQIWGTEVLPIDPNIKCYMNNVRVPVQTLEKCLELRELLFSQHNCYLVPYELDGKVYVRISTHIYNTLEDYEFAATKFLELLNAQNTSNNSIVDVQK